MLTHISLIWSGKTLEDKEIPIKDIEKFCKDFFANPWNNLIMNMFAVHDGDMTLKEALNKQSGDSV